MMPFFPPGVREIDVHRGQRSVWKQLREQPLAVAVDSPMTEADHVRRVGIFAEQNPRPKVAETTFTPASGAAVFDTKIRLAGTQDIVVVAEMSDGSLWSRRQKVMVVVGACTTLPARY